MGGLAELLVAVFLAIGPNGYRIHQQLADSQVREALPVAALQAVAPRLWIVVHQHPEWPMAFYAPSGYGTQIPESVRELPRLLPDLDVPRLFLYGPSYQPEGRMVAVEAMPVDVAEYYFRALLEAFFDLELAASAPGYRAILDERAARMRSVPPEYRREAYAAALVEFGAHALAVGNELWRGIRRRRATGEEPCPGIDHPVALFGLWGTIFGAGRYRGGYYLRDAGRWVTSAETLERHDKELFGRHVFGSHWSGNVREDFARFCPGAPSSSGWQGQTTQAVGAPPAVVSSASVVGVKKFALALPGQRARARSAGRSGCWDFRPRSSPC